MQLLIGVLILGVIGFLMWLKKRNLQKRDDAIERMMDERFKDLFSDIERIKKSQDERRERE